MVRTWKVPIHKTCVYEPGVFCFALCCCHAASYRIRRRAIGDDMSKYKCCQGYGRCLDLREDRCPQTCLAAEVVCCFVASVFATRWVIQEDRGIVNTDTERRATAATVATTYVSVPSMCVGNGLLSALRWISDSMWCVLCACAQTQHYIELSEVPESHLSRVKNKYSASFRVKIEAPPQQDAMIRFTEPGEGPRLESA